MKNTRHILTFVMVCAICMTMVLSVSAASKAAGIYGTLTGNASQYQNTIQTNTSITSNPDSAQLTVKVMTYNDSCDSGTYLTSDKANSLFGVTSFSFTSPMRYVYDNRPTEYRVDHIVSNGDSYVTFVINSYGIIDQSYLN